MATTTPEVHGAAGNGYNDDTAAARAAIATGAHVEFDPAKRYKITGPLWGLATDQELVGGGIMPVGNFHAIYVGPCRGTRIDLTMYCAQQTGGFAVVYNGVERAKLDLLINDSGFNGVHIERSNTVTINELHAIELRGDTGIRWYGNAAARSDILNVKNAVMGWAAGDRQALGFDWFGNCHSLSVENMQVVGKPGAVSPLRHGMVIRGHGDGLDPQIGRIEKFASDFTHDHGVIAIAGDDIEFDGIYQNGSVVGSGIWVNAGLQPYAIRVRGGKTIGNARFGIEAHSRILGRDVLSYANAMGTHHGHVDGPILTR